MAAPALKSVFIITEFVTELSLCPAILILQEILRQVSFGPDRNVLAKG